MIVTRIWGESVRTHALTPNPVPFHGKVWRTGTSLGYKLILSIKYPGPKLENLEQLTEPSADVRDVFWSSDIQIAFISRSDIYIVETSK